MFAAYAGNTVDGGRTVTNGDNGFVIAALNQLAILLLQMWHLPPRKLLYALHGRLLHYTRLHFITPWQAGCSVHIRTHPYKIAVYTIPPEG